MDWWLVAVWDIVMPNSPDKTKCHHLFLAGARIIMISKIASVLWMNSILKRWDAVLSCLSLDLIFEQWIELRNAPVYPAKDLLPSSLILLVAKKSSQVLRDDVIRNVVTCEAQPPRSPRQQASVRPRSSTIHPSEPASSRTPSKR